MNGIIRPIWIDPKYINESTENEEYVLEHHNHTTTTIPFYNVGIDYKYDKMDKDGNYIYNVDVPGVEKSDIEIEIESLSDYYTHCDLIKLKYKRKNVIDDNYSERTKFLKLENDADIENAIAELKNGVLTITIPSTKSPPIKIRIK